MQYGVFVNILDAQDGGWRRQFEFVQSLSSDCSVEIWLEHLPTAAQVRLIRSLVGTRNLLVHAPFVGVSLASHDRMLRKASVERCRRALGSAGELGATVFTCHAGAVGAWTDDERSFDLLAASFGILLTTGGGPQVTIENMPRRGGGSRELVVTAGDITAVLERCPGLGVTLDIGHCLQNGEEIAEAVHALANRLCNVHLHDGFAGGAAHKAIGVGELPLRLTLATLAADGYVGNVSLETIGESDTRSSWVALCRELEQRGDAIASKTLIQV